MLTEMPYTNLWSNIPTEVQQRFKSHAATLTFKRGDLVYNQGDKPNGIYFVRSGLVGLTMVGKESGKEHLLRFFRQGQFFGHRSLFSNEGYHATAIVLEPTVIELVPKQVVLDATKSHPEILNAVVTVLSKELRRAETQHVMILENQILSRVAQSLVYLKDLHPDHNWTRQEIANFCASTVSTVIKALSQLEDLGLIEQSGRSINILQRQQLIALQDEIL